MAKFQLTAPNGGGTYEIDAPDEGSAVSALQQSIGGQSNEKTDPGAFVVDMGNRKAAPAVDAADVAKSAGIGLAKGSIGLTTAPQDLSDFAGNGFEYLMRKGLNAVGVGPKTGNDFADIAQQNRTMSAGSRILPRADEVQSAIEQGTGKFYQPQTTAGKYAETIASFVPAVIAPGAVTGQTAGNLARRTVTQAALPGIASEGAGQLAQGTDYEQAARMAGGFLPTIAGSAFRPNTDAMLQRATRGVTDQQFQQARQLMQEAGQSGLQLTTAEALQFVTGGATNMADIQRLVEGHGGLRDMTANRPAQVRQVGNQALDQVGPAPADPHMVGSQAGAVFDDTVQGVRGAINDTTRPAYQRAEPQLLDPGIYARVRNDPTWQLGLQRVRNDPLIGPTLAHLPDNSVGIADAIHKQLDQTGRNLRSQFNANGNDYAASIAEGGGASARQAAERSSPDYAAAQAVQAQLRQRYLEPIQNGPIGQLAKRDLTTQDAINALFPANPLPNSAQGITDAIGALNAQHPAVARELVRTHAESVLNQATKNNIGGPNEFGGAKFVAAIRGNAQQAENLNAAIAASSGPAARDGFNRLLDYLQATGERQAIGSRTSFNDAGMASLKQGSPASQGVKAALTGGIKLPAIISERLDAWKIGRNVDGLAAVLAHPEGIDRLRDLSRTTPGSARETALIARLAILGSPQPSK